MRKALLFLLLTGYIYSQQVNNLSDALRYYNVLKVKEFLSQGADPNAKVDGEPGLTYIAKNYGVQTKPILKMLIESNADVDAMNKQELTVIVYTASARDWETTQMLVERNANLNVGYKFGSQPPILSAIAWGSKELVKSMLDHNADPNIFTESFSSPLIAAITNNKPEIVKMLLEYKAKPDVRKLDSETALMWGVHYGNPEIINLLISAGANVNLKAGVGKTALMMAAEYGHKEAVQILLDNGADPTLKTKYKDTALSLAQENKRNDVVEILKKAKKKK